MTLAAKYFQGNRKQKSLQKIQYAIEDIFSEGMKIKQKDVIERSGLSPRTVKNYWDQFKGMVEEMNGNV